MSTERRPRFLVTAGNTRERIDEVRDWGNVFTGETGYAIARAVARVGDVDLLTSNAAHLSACHAGRDGLAIRASGFSTHADLRAAIAGAMAAHRYAGVFMTAAVADYHPVRTFQVVRREVAATAGQEVWLVRDAQRGKVKSDHRAIAVLGEQTEKLVDLFRGDWGHRGLLVKFKLEVGIPTEQLLEIGRRSRAASGADYLVANTLKMVRGPTPGAYLIGATSAEWVARADLPQRLAALAASTWGPAVAATARSFAAGAKA